MLNRSTAWRLLATLDAHGLIERDPVSQRYSLGYAFLRIAAGADVDPLVRRARPVLEQLARETAEATNLAVAKRFNLVYVDQVDPPQIMAPNWFGRPVPLHATSTGKAYLAFLPPEERRAALPERLDRYTATTITDRRRLGAELDGGAARRVGGLRRRARRVALRRVGARVVGAGQARCGRQRVGHRAPAAPRASPGDRTADARSREGNQGPPAVSGPLVEARLEGDVCILRLCREEKLNALSTALEQALGEALDRPAVRDSACLVLTGSGRAFSAGADISEFADRDPEAIARYYRESGGVYERIAALPQPTISAIHGLLPRRRARARARDRLPGCRRDGGVRVPRGLDRDPAQLGRHGSRCAPARAGARQAADSARRAADCRRGGRCGARDGGRPGRRLARPRARARKRARRAATARRQHREAGDRCRARSRRARRRS